jgi:hypothetical protein
VSPFSMTFFRILVCASSILLVRVFHLGTNRVAIFTFPFLTQYPPAESTLTWSGHLMHPKDRGRRVVHHNYLSGQT